MRYGARGIKGPNFFQNEMLIHNDLSLIHQFTYENLCDILSDVIGPVTNDVIVSGCEISHTADMTF